MTIYNVAPTFKTENTLTYTVLPYNLKGTIKTHLKYNGFKSLISFLKNCRLTKKSAEKLCKRKCSYRDLIN